MTVSVESGDSGWSEYVIGVDELRNGAKLIMGDLKLGDAICSSTDYKTGQYFRMVVSFSTEENITSEQGRKISKEFMKLLMHGYRDDEFHQDIVEHIDTENLHYHIRVPKLNLLTGTQLHYHYLSDIDRKDKIHQYLEAKYNLLSPFEKRKLQPDPREKVKQINQWREGHGQKPFDLSTKKGRGEAEERLSDYISEAIIDGLIKSLDDVLGELKGMGFIIANVGHDNGKNFDYVTIQNKDGKIRLRGDKFGKRFYEYNREDRAEAVRSGKSLKARNRDDRPSLEEAKRALDGANRRRVHFLEKRFRRARERALSSIEASFASNRRGDRDRGADKQEKRENSKSGVRHKREPEGTNQRENKVLGVVDERNRIKINERVREARKRAEARNRIIREQTEEDLKRIRTECRRIENEVSEQLSEFNKWRNERRNEINRIADEFIDPTEGDYRSIKDTARIRGHNSEIETHLNGIFQYFGSKFDLFKQRIDKGSKGLIGVITDTLLGRIEEVKIEELSRFKCEINLAEYAQSFGYAVDKTKSTKVSPVLKKDGDTLIIGQNKSDSHYIYFNANNNSDKGSIIDFVKNRTNETLGHIRKRLRTWLNIPQPNIERVEVKAATLDEIELKVSKDKAFTFWNDIEDQSFFARELRNIPNNYLSEGRTSKDVKFDGEQWYFALRDSQDEICGVEIRNKEGRNARIGAEHKKGIFAAGGQDAKACEKIIITESTIDAKSAEVMERDATYWSHTFVSIGGNAGIIAETALKELCDRLPNADIIVATDNDTTGDKHAQKIKDIIGHDRNHTRFRPLGKALNDDLPSFRANRKKKRQKTNTQGLRR